MADFKRLPTIRMLMLELIGTTVQLQNGEKDSYQPSIYLSPTGAEVNRVLVAGVAVEKEDVGSDNSFWRVRIVDPTGASFVYAGQYQPEAMKAIQKLEVPSFVIVSGKLSHYTPEQGGETIVSIRAESIAPVSLELRDHALADIAMHTVRRIQDAKGNKNVQCYYSNYDFGSLAKSISGLLDQVIEDSAQAGATPPATPAPEVKPLEPAKAPEVKPPAAAPEVKPPEPPKESPPPAPAQAPKEPEKPPAEQAKPPAADKKKKDKKKDAAKGPAEAPKEGPKESPAPAKPEVKAEPPKEAPKPGATATVLGDSEKMVLDILKTHKPQGALAKDTIGNVLRALGYAMLNVDMILAKLKTAGEITEPKDGFFQAM
jgi:RPA family protein